MEIVICALLAYVLSGVLRVSKDLGKKVISRPAWTTNATAGKIIMAALGWPIDPIVEATRASGQFARSLAFGLLGVTVQMITVTAYIWFSYAIAGVVFDVFELQLALAAVIVAAGSFSVLPLMTYIMAPVTLLFAWPLSLLFPKKK